MQAYQRSLTSSVVSPKLPNKLPCLAEDWLVYHKIPMKRPAPRNILIFEPEIPPTSRLHHYSLASLTVAKQRETFSLNGCDLSFWAELDYKRNNLKDKLRILSAFHYLFPELREFYKFSRRLLKVVFTITVGIRDKKARGD